MKQVVCVHNITEVPGIRSGQNISWRNYNLKRTSENQKLNYCFLKEHGSKILNFIVVFLKGHGSRSDNLMVFQESRM